jgi:hypothetical protein
MEVGSGDHRPDPLQELRRDVVAAALGAQHLLQPALKLGVTAARGALPEMPLDLHALDADELPVEVELDLAEHVLAVSP